MKDKSLGLAAVGCFVTAGIPFWLWKLYIITGPKVRILIRLFIALYGMALVLSFILGGRVIIKTTKSWTRRSLLFAALLMIEAYAALMAALGMNFVGK